MNEIEFIPSKTAFSLGAELEVQVLDRESLNLTPKAPEIIASLKNPKLKLEIFQSMLEIVTDVCQNTDEIEKDLVQSISILENFSESENIRISSGGSHPFADYNERIISDLPRYHEVIQRNQWLAKRTSVFGLHVHIGMRNGDDCIDFMNFFAARLPMLIALSASSPFWKGSDSGLVSTRATVYESIPTCGTPMIFNNWKEFSDRYSQLIHLRSIGSFKDLWWDLRPSPIFGTLEIRICDGPSNLAELKAIVAFIQMLAVWFDENRNEYQNKFPNLPEPWILRENKWRSIRYGLHSFLIDTERMENTPMENEISKWLERIKPIAQRWKNEESIALIRDIARHGNNAERQRNYFRTNPNVKELVLFNAKEFQVRKPSWN